MSKKEYISEGLTSLLTKLSRMFQVPPPRLALADLPEGVYGQFSEPDWTIYIARLRPGEVRLERDEEKILVHEFIHYVIALIRGAEYAEELLAELGEHALAQKLEEIIDDKSGDDGS